MENLAGINKWRPPLYQKAAKHAVRPGMAEDVIPAQRSIRCYVGLGSNLDDPVAQVTSALSRLQRMPASRLIGVSSLYRSKPLGPLNQPDFINAVVSLDTSMTALELLDKLQQIETLQRRKRLVYWGPRTLDLDLLLYGQEKIQSERLRIPHPHLMWRNFVLVPLAEIAPDLILQNNINASTYLALSRMKKPFMLKPTGLFGKKLRG